MNEENESAKAEGEALPAKNIKVEGESLVNDAKVEVKSLEERVVAAIEAWYDKHFHKAHLAGLPTLPSDDKALLIQHVVDAVAPTKE